jgi:hypothetical protein
VAAAALTWPGSPETGYRLSDGSAELVKRGRAWFLLAGGQEIKMPRRGSFDHAERALNALRRNRR